MARLLQSMHLRSHWQRIRHLSGVQYGQVALTHYLPTVIMNLMCGRYTLTVQEQELAEEFGISLGDCPYSIRYNIAPTQNVPVIRVVDGQRQLRPLRWGLVPHWAKDLKMGARMINARS